MESFVVRWLAERLVVVSTDAIKGKGRRRLLTFITGNIGQGRILDNVYRHGHSICNVQNLVPTPS